MSFLKGMFLKKGYSTLKFFTETKYILSATLRELILARTNYGEFNVV